MRIYAELHMGGVICLERWPAIGTEGSTTIELMIDRDLLEQAMRSNPQLDVRIRIHEGAAFEAVIRAELDRIDVEISRAKTLEERVGLIRDRRAIARRLEPRARSPR